MTDFPGEDMLVGAFAALAVPFILWTLRRGHREGRLPIGRSHVARAERPGAYRVLLFLYVGATLLLAFIALDLLFHIRTRLAS